MIVCDKCSFEFNLKEMQEQKVNIKGDELTLVFFTCPKCNEIYRVTLKDEKCAQLEEGLNKTKKRIRRNFGNSNLVLAEQLDKMVFVKKERLASYMKNLNAKYSGTFTFEESENNKDNKTKLVYHENHGNNKGEK